MKIRVLLADDDAAIVQMLARVLELDGLEVATCASAAEAVNRLANSDFDLVITDMRMETPYSGCQVIEAAAGRPARPGVRPRCY